MVKTSIKTDPCESCKTSFNEMSKLSLSEKVAGNSFHSIYSNHYICPNCESIYVCYDDDFESFGHQKRYKVSDEEKSRILKRIRYKDWLKVGKPKTEYGMYRKHGIISLHQPFNGHLYSLIERAFQEKRKNDIEKLERVYPEKVKMVREFIV